jgi:fucose permease
LFFFFYLGAVLTAGGWVVEYLIVVRDGDINQMGFVSAGFNGGSLLGRMLLAEPIHRFGVRKMIFSFTIISIGLQLLFWLYVTRLRVMRGWTLLTISGFQISLLLPSLSAF